MKTARRFATALVAFVALGTAGCSDSTAPQEVQLGEQESMEIFGALLIAMSNGLSTSVSPTAAGLLLARDTEPINATVACQQGGSIVLNGSMTDNTDANGTGTLKLNLTQTPRQCKVSTSRGSYTVDGDPNLAIMYDFNFRNGQPYGDAVMTMKGAYRFAGSATGRCTMDLTYKLSMSTGQGNVRGSACGNPVNQSY